MYFLLEKVDSHCYVNLPEGNQLYSSVSYVIYVSCAAVWSRLKVHTFLHTQNHMSLEPPAAIFPPRPAANSQSTETFAASETLVFEGHQPLAMRFQGFFRFFSNKPTKNFIKMDGFSCPMWRKSVWLIRWFLLPFFGQQEVPSAMLQCVSAVSDRC